MGLASASKFSGGLGWCFHLLARLSPSLVQSHSIATIPLQDSLHPHPLARRYRREHYTIPIHPTSKDRAFIERSRERKELSESTVEKESLDYRPE